MSPSVRSHPRCWTGERYVHSCHAPSGRTCLDCDQPAGTPWGPYWCPDCDVVRLDRVSTGLATLAGATQRNPDEQQAEAPDELRTRYLQDRLAVALSILDAHDLMPDYRLALGARDTTDHWMLTELSTQGGDAGSDYNDGDLNGWFGWSITDGVLTVTYEPADDNGTPGPTQTASWLLTEQEN